MPNVGDRYGRYERRYMRYAPDEAKEPAVEIFSDAAYNFDALTKF